ncbi:SRPBCC family protein [Nioella sp.]|uniref:SRPBCC family protein n=1 Tax=Nioella sp. TaxID=1912091 RepID=UPI003A8423A2
MAQIIDLSSCAIADADMTQWQRWTRTVARPGRQVIPARSRELIQLFKTGKKTNSFGVIMNRSFPFASTAVAAPLLAIAFSSPLAADTPCDTRLMSGSIAQLSQTHATVDTSVLINAAPEEVWATLTDFDNMASWSTGTLQGMTGNIRDGGSVTITFIFGTDETGEPNVMEVPHTLIYADGQAFGWSDPFPEDIGGGHDNHLYRVEACGDQSLFVQSDEIVDNLYAASFAAQLLPMYQTFNAELKAAVEN